LNKGAVVFLVVVIASCITIIWFSANQPPQTDNSDNQTFPRETPLILPNLESITPKDNLTKGMTLACNFSVSSLADEELVVPLSLKLYMIVDGYGDEVDLQEAGFCDCQISTEVFVLEPSGALSTLVTLKISDDVEVGKYQLEVVTGNWEVTHVGGATLNFDVVG
jgi:hypothetical protein